MKKKISPDELDLSIEETGDKKLSPRFTETKTCGYYCNTVDPTLPDCKTIEEAGCLPTETCWTIEPECETNVECYDSKSNAQQCCAISEKDNTICENCLTVGTCGADSQCYCLVTDNNCPISGEDESCMCALTDQETCEPPMPVTAITDCTLCDN